MFTRPRYALRCTPSTPQWTATRGSSSSSDRASDAAAPPSASRVGSRRRDSLATIDRAPLGAHTRVDHVVPRVWYDDIGGTRAGRSQDDDRRTTYRTHAHRHRRDPREPRARRETHTPHTQLTGRTQEKYHVAETSESRSHSWCGIKCVSAARNATATQRQRATGAYALRRARGFASLASLSLDSESLCDV